jgi:hypothetical protein
MEYADGTVHQVYCHRDGYLRNNGRLLSEHYQDPFKVRELLDLGDISSLRKNIGTAHAFSQMDSSLTSEQYKALYGDMTTFYNRDRREVSDTSSAKFRSVAEYFAHSEGQEYDYILLCIDGKPVWLVRCTATHGEWVTVAEAFRLEELEYAVA